MATLQNECSLIQKEINAVNDIITSIREVSLHESPDMLSFLIRFKSMSELIESCLTKPIKRNNYSLLKKASSNVRCDDFTRELDNRKKKLNKYEKLKKLVKVKDEIIWNLVNSGALPGDKLLSEKEQNEVTQWAK